METIEITGKNEKVLTLKNVDELEKVYKMIMKEEDFIIKHTDFSEVFTSSNYMSKLKNGDFKLNSTKPREE